MFVFQQRAIGASGVNAKGMRLLATDDDLRSFLLERFSTYIDQGHFLIRISADVEREFRQFLDYRCRVTVLFVGELAPEAKLIKTPDLLDMFASTAVYQQYTDSIVQRKLLARRLP
ncbi:MAG: hypothetical protein WC761_00810 [Candidatus Paceibacterota bacterium]|jgi:hypothetical protein